MVRGGQVPKPSQERSHLMHTRLSLFAAAAVGAVAAASSAGVVNFSVYENAHSADLSGLSLTAEFIDQGSAVDIVFRNESTLSSVVTVIYLELCSLTSASGGISIVDQSAGVSFASGGSPHNPAGIPDAFGLPWGGTIARFGAQSPGPMNGINAGLGESLTLRIECGDLSSADLVSAFLSGEIRIAQHVQSVGPNAVSVWAVTPTPGAIPLLALAGLGGLSRRRRSDS